MDNTNIIVLIVVIVCFILYMLSERKKDNFDNHKSTTYPQTIFKNNIPQIPDEQICKFIRNILSDTNFQKQNDIPKIPIEKEINNNNIIINELLYKQNLILNGINSELNNMLKLNEN